jgi:hypothetical protein
MTWLLRLYPPPWRRRYGAEVADMLADRAFSLRIAIDLVAGAIDVWLHPSATLAAATPVHSNGEEKTMLNRIARLDCSGMLGPDVTKADHWKAGVALIVSTAVLTAAWMALHVRFRDDPTVDSLSMMPFMFGMLLSMRYTYLKGRSGAVQAVFIGGFTLFMAAVLLAAGWVAVQL